MTRPRVTRKSSAVGGTDFGQKSDLKVQAAALKATKIGGREIRKGSHGGDETDIPNTRRGRQHSVERLDIEGTIDFTEERAKSRKNVVVAQLKRRERVFEKLVTGTRIHVPPSKGDQEEPALFSITT